ncbi:MAG: hypothetical protein VYA34_11190 [Myxococcota bacterium]|nr:hypothetical protein [Myxococcota bacterium]
MKSVSSHQILAITEIAEGPIWKLTHMLKNKRVLEILTNPWAREVGEPLPGD